MDLEARLHSEHPQELRLWLRMLTCTQLLEKHIRTRLREDFDTTLPRFDLMAQLERAPEGLRMNALSQRLMVTGGNVTGITDALVKDGWVERVRVAGDGRGFTLHMTPLGRERFKAMAEAHEGWIVEALADLSEADAKQLHRLLGQVKQHLLHTTVEAHA